MVKKTEGTPAKTSKVGKKASPLVEKSPVAEKKPSAVSCTATTRSGESRTDLKTKTSATGTRGSTSRDRPSGVQKSTERESQGAPTSGAACTVCRDEACLRMLLRMCGHNVCVTCLLGYLQGQIVLKAKVGIRCPSGICAQEIHENDIRAILDEQEPGLDVFMSPQRRQWLQYCHDKDSIVLGLAGPNPQHQKDFTRRCPLCKNVYYKRFGCHNVVCPNRRCQTRFCWTCERPIRGMGHFAGDRDCRVSYDDIRRGSVILHLLEDVNALVFLFVCPIAFTFFYFLLPFCVLFAFPYYAARRVYRTATRQTYYLTVYEKIALVPQMIVAVALGTLMGLPAALCSFFTGGCLFPAWAVIVILKFSGVLGKMLNCYDRLLCQPIASLLGLGHIREMLREAREEEKREEERQQFEQEREQMAQAEVILEPEQQQQQEREVTPSGGDFT